MITLMLLRSLSPVQQWRAVPDERRNVAGVSPCGFTLTTHQHSSCIYQRLYNITARHRLIAVMAAARRSSMCSASDDAGDFELAYCH